MTCDMFEPVVKKETFVWTVHYDIASCYHGCSIPHEVSLWATVVTFYLAKYKDHMIIFEILPNWNINNSRTYHPTAMKLDLFGLVIVCPIQVWHQGPIINCHSQPSWVLTTSFLRPRRNMLVIVLGTTRMNVHCIIGSLMFALFVFFTAILRFMAFTCMYVIYQGLPSILADYYIESFRYTFSLLTSRYACSTSVS